MRRNLFWLNDEQWLQIEPYLPTDVRGKDRVDDRRVISGILHVIKSGCRWCDCPPEYHQDVLIGMVTPMLDRNILWFIRIPTGKFFAEVTKAEALEMLELGRHLSEEYPDEEKRPAHVQRAIDDGLLAEGLVFGHLNGGGGTSRVEELREALHAEGLLFGHQDKQQVMERIRTLEEDGDQSEEAAKADGDEQT